MICSDATQIVISWYCGFGWKMSIQANIRQFLGILTPKLCCHWFNPKGMQLPQRHALRDIDRWNRFTGVFCRLVQRNHYAEEKVKLMGGRQNVIFHPYVEKPPVIRLLPNVRCRFPSPTESVVPIFVFIALIVFGWPDPQNWVFLLMRWPLQQLELYQALLWYEMWAGTLHSVTQANKFRGSTWLCDS